MKIVHWRDVVSKNFGDMKEFDRITRNILYCTRSDLPIKQAFKEVAISLQELYDKTRWMMRHCGYEIRGKDMYRHGWYSSYIEKDELKFFCTVPAGERSYITIAQFADLQNSQGLDNMIDEYYNTRPIVQDVIASMPKSRKDLDGDESEW